MQFFKFAMISCRAKVVRAERFCSALRFFFVPCYKCADCSCSAPRECCKKALHPKKITRSCTALWVFFSCIGCRIGFAVRPDVSCFWAHRAFFWMLSCLFCFSLITAVFTTSKRQPDARCKYFTYDFPRWPACVNTELVFLASICTEYLVLNHTWYTCTSFCTQAALTNNKTTSVKKKCSFLHITEFSGYTYDVLL